MPAKMAELIGVLLGVGEARNCVLDGGPIPSERSLILPLL